MIFAWLAVLGLIFWGCTPSSAPDKSMHLVPEPVLVTAGGAGVDLAEGYSFHTGDTALQKLIPVLSDEIYKLTGIRSDPEGGKGVTVELKLKTRPRKEAYHLRVDNGILLEGSSYAAVAEGSVTLLQLIGPKKQVPGADITDSAFFDYRGLEVDLARSWHDIENIKEIVNLCRWYKIKYLHLHFNDDQSFTFPSAHYPKLPTPNRHYTLDQLTGLDRYAIERGVTIVPEIEAPSHSSSFIKAMPELFGIRDLAKNNYTLNMGKDAVYDALDTLIGEMSDVFHESPYIHIGCDEVFGQGMEDDPDIRRYMALHHLHSMEELYQQYIVRVNSLVKKHGKQAIVWSGFQKAVAVKIPNDILVMEYETSNYAPQELINDGYRIINASFKPLYVVNNQRWDADSIYENWDAFTWQMPGNLPGKDKGIHIAPAAKVAGGSMSSWEQSERKEIPSLRRRLAAMSERLWNAKKRTVAAFMDDLDHTDEKFGRLLSPVVISEKGRTYPGSYDGNSDEKFWFDSSLTIDLKSALPAITMHYTLDGSYPGPGSAVYTGPVSFDRDVLFRVQAYGSNGDPVGFSINNSYKLHPVHADIKGVRPRSDMMPNSWEKAKFDDSVTLAFSSRTGDHIEYTISGDSSQVQSGLYRAPVALKQSGSVSAQVFDAQGKPVGKPFRQDFVRVRKESSLTTGKPVTSSSDQLDPRLAKLVVDGEITLDDYWSDKVNSWIDIDLGKAEKIERIKVYTYWDNNRYYQYRIDVSNDNVHWTQVVDFSHNTTVATSTGYIHDFDSVSARYIRITMLFNSSNSMMHLVEINAFGDRN
jgi:hexosaminidase